MNQSLISLKNLRFFYNGEEGDVLRKLSLEINKGDVVAILGPNGVGKTTLLHLILGWLKAEEGTIRLLGKSLHQYRRKEAGRLMGLVPQDEAITFEYSLLEYVLHGRYPHLRSLQTPGPDDRYIALNALKRVGMEDLADRPVTHLSGGEKQLVLIARTLAQDPALILLDEPMSNLDLANKLRIISVIRSLKNEGVTVLFTTHEPEITASLCNSVILMGKDKYIEQGPVESILTGNSLSRIYNVTVKIQEVDGRKIILWN